MAGVGHPIVGDHRYTKGFAKARRSGARSIWQPGPGNTSRAYASTARPPQPNAQPKATTGARHSSAGRPDDRSAQCPPAAEVSHGKLPDQWLRLGEQHGLHGEDEPAANAQWDTDFPEASDGAQRGKRLVRPAEQSGVGGQGDQAASRLASGGVAEQQRPRSPGEGAASAQLEAPAVEASMGVLPRPRGTSAAQEQGCRIGGDQAAGSRPEVTAVSAPDALRPQLSPQQAAAKQRASAPDVQAAGAKGEVQAVGMSDGLRPKPRWVPPPPPPATAAAEHGVPEQVDPVVSRPSTEPGALRTIALWALELSCQHPITGKNMTFRLQ